MQVAIPENVARESFRMEVKKVVTTLRYCPPETLSQFQYWFQSAPFIVVLSFFRIYSRGQFFQPSILAHQSGLLSRTRFFVMSLVWVVFSIEIGLQDVWSAAVTLAELKSGKAFLQGDADKGSMADILKLHAAAVEEMFDMLGDDDEASSVIMPCLAREPRERSSAEVVKKSWFSLVETSLGKDPNFRFRLSKKTRLDPRPISRPTVGQHVGELAPQPKPEEPAAPPHTPEPGDKIQLAHGKWFIFS